RAFTASDLISDVNYTKRNIDSALDPLTLAGLLEIRPVRNQHQYQLTDQPRLQAFVGELPRLYPRWTPIFSCLGRVMDFAARAPELVDRVAMVEANRAFRQIEPLLAESGLTGPGSPIEGP